MADPEALAALEGDIQKAQEAVAYQGDSVRSLKASAKEGKADKVSCGLLSTAGVLAWTARADQSRGGGAFREQVAGV